MDELIPELRKWNDGRGISVEDWVQLVGNFQHAIAYSTLFWPEFQLHDGCVFFAGLDEANYQKWLKTTKGNKTSVQAVMNHRHILDLFEVCIDLDAHSPEVNHFNIAKMKQNKPLMATRIFQNGLISDLDFGFRISLTSGIRVCTPSFISIRRARTNSRANYLFGCKLKDMWQTKLNRDFPDQQITVSFPEEPEDDLLSYEITFFIPHQEDLMKTS